MNPVIFKEEGMGKEPVYLKLSQCEGETALVAVNRHGTLVANLITFFSHGEAMANNHAYAALEQEGFDTSFTEWTITGAMKVNHD